MIAWLLGCGEATDGGAPVGPADQTCVDVAETGDLDGVVHMRQTWVRDAAGLLLERHRDSGPDGVEDGWATFEYDGEGRLIVQEASDIWYSDDGHPDRDPTDGREQWSWDDHGNELTWTRDEDMDGAIEYGTARTYDGDDNVLTYEPDDDGDGQADSRSSYRWEGGLLRERVDENGEGFVTSRATYTYDDEGHGIVTDSDHGADGSVDVRTTSSFEGDQEVLREVDEGFDGIVDIRYTLDYDADANLVYWTRDDDADGVLESTESLTYDGEGRRLTDEIDSDADGAPEFRQSQTYDVRGNVLTSLWEQFGDTSASRLDIYTFDVEDRVSTNEHRSTVEGVEIYAFRTVYSYGCPAN